MTYVPMQMMTITGNARTPTISPLRRWASSDPLQTPVFSLKLFCRSENGAKGSRRSVHSGKYFAINRLFDYNCDKLGADVSICFSVLFQSMFNEKRWEMQHQMPCGQPLESTLEQEEQAMQKQYASADG